MTFNDISTKDHSVSVNGDWNTIHTTFFNKGINRSYVFDICCKIANAKISICDDVDNLANGNSNWENKYNYNNVNQFKELFADGAYAYDDLEDILNGIDSNKNKLIRNIHSIYLRTLIKLNESNPPKNGDSVLYAVYNEIYTMIDSCEQPSDNILTLEDRESSIYLIMFYVFTKCKLLQPLPRREDTDVNK